MTSIDEAVESLYDIVDKEPYRTTKSWVNTPNFTVDTKLTYSHANESFSLDQRLYNKPKE